jgi:hypothetical protein
MYDELLAGSDPDEVRDDTCRYQFLLVSSSVYFGIGSILTLRNRVLNIYVSPRGTGLVEGDDVR